MRARKQSGHVILELALASGVMLTALGGTFQFGYSFYVYNQLVTAVGNGARYASTRTYRAATPGDLEKGRTAIRNMVLFGDPHPGQGSWPVAAGLTPANVRVDWIETGAGAPPTAVRISIVGYHVDAVFGAMSMDGRPDVQFPFLGQYAPTGKEQ